METIAQYAEVIPASSNRMIPAISDYVIPVTVIPANPNRVLYFGKKDGVHRYHADIRRPDILPDNIDITHKLRKVLNPNHVINVEVFRAGRATGDEEDKKYISAYMLSRKIIGGNIERSKNIIAAAMTETVVGLVDWETLKLYL